MKGSEFDEAAFFRAIAESRARALLIGRRALVLLGLPVLTVDYDFWIHIDDIESFNSGSGREARRRRAPSRGRGRPPETRRRAKTLQAVDNQLTKRLPQ